MVPAVIVAAGLIFVILWIAVEQVQQNVYDAVVPQVALRALVASVPLAVLLVRFPLLLEEVFTTPPFWFLVQAAVWGLVLRFAFQFSWGIAFGLGVPLYGGVAWALPVVLTSMGLLA